MPKRSLKGGAGELNHRVTIQQEIPRDTDGASDPYYEDLEGGTVWASIEGLSGRESFTANQVQSTSSHLIRTRFVSFIEPKHRFRYYDKRRDRNRFFNITASIDPDGSGTYQEHYVTEWTEAPTSSGVSSA